MQKAKYKQYSQRHADDAKSARATIGYDYIEAFIARGIRVQQGASRAGGVADAK